MAGIAAHGWRGQKGERLCITKVRSASTYAFTTAAASQCVDRRNEYCYFRQNTPPNFGLRRLQAMSAPPTAAVHDKKTTLIETDLPSRLDRLPWGRFHSLIVVALGVTWLLDGLEVTLAGAVASALKSSPSL